MPFRINLSKTLASDSVSERLRRSLYDAGGIILGCGETNSVFHLVGKIPEAILVQNILLIGSASLGRNSCTTLAGISRETNEVILECLRRW